MGPAQPNQLLASKLAALVSHLHSWSTWACATRVLPAYWLPAQPHVSGPSVNAIGNVGSITPDAAEQWRGERTHEGQPHEVQSGHAWHDAALLHGPAVLAEDGKIDPIQVA